MPAEQFDVLVEQMHQAGERLVAALKSENEWAALACQSPYDDELFDQWARARQRVEERQHEYADAVACCISPAKEPGPGRTRRGITECGENYGTCRS